MPSNVSTPPVGVRGEFVTYSDVINIGLPFGKEWLGLWEGLVGQQKSLANSSFTRLSVRKEAATYSPALHCSTIGASRLNFSVRNGKRWNPAAITT